MACVLPAGVDVAWLKANFLGGIPLVAVDGTVLPDSTFEMTLCSAFSRVASFTGLRLLPTTLGEGGDRSEGVTLLPAERRDSDHNSDGEYHQTLLYERPLRRINQLALRYGSLPQSMKIPNSWLHIRNHEQAEVEIIIDRSSAIFEKISGMPFMLGGIHGRNRMPSWFEWSYEAGFHPTEHPLPHELLEAIGYLAAIPILMRQGAQVLEPGIASFSTSQDGLAQSFTSDGFQKLIAQYKQIADDNMQSVRDRYRGIPMGVL